MRKQKVFNRVSAWLLVWTMVLSALAGNVTVRAEEPEEVDVQIEADTDVQTEEDADMQIEANQGPEDEEGVDEPEEYDGPTGLVVYTDVEEVQEEVDEDSGEPRWLIKGVREDCDPEKQLGRDLRSNLWYLANREEGQGVGEANPVKFEDLIVEKQQNGEWNEATEGKDYELSPLEFDEGVENQDSYIRIRFNDIGDYRIRTEDDEDDCIRVDVDYPFTGFYRKPVLSPQDYIDEQHEYTAGETIYAIIYEPEGHTVSLDGENGDGTPCGVSLDGGDNVLEGVDYSVENLGKQDGYVYAITIAEDCQKNFALNVAAQVTRVDDEDSWPDSNHLNLSGPVNGLHILWPDWDDDDNMKEFGEIIDPDNACKSTTGNPSGQHIYLCTKDGEGDSTQITNGDDIELFYKKKNGYIKITDANKDIYGSIEVCKDKDHNHEGKDVFWFTPEKEGVYKISNGDSFAIFEVLCPDFGFYKGDDISAENYLEGDFDYYSEEGDNRTIYFLKRADIDDNRTIGSAHAMMYGDQDKTDIFIQTEEVDNGLKITIDPDCQQDFDLKVDIEQEDQEEPQQESICLWYSAPNANLKEGLDGPDKAFSGCMLTEWGYRSGAFWERNCLPDNVLYWVHGDSVQEVLDKLAALKSVEVTEDGETKTVSITPTGYYQINMSCYTGNKVEEENQETEQIITLPEGAKGILMYSSSQLEAAWGSADTNFDFEDGEPVMVYTGFDEMNTETGEIDEKMACYLEFEENGEDKSGWYEVTKENGVYVYDQKKPVTASYEDENGNIWEVPNPKDWWSDEWRDRLNDDEAFEKLFEGISAKYQTSDKYYSWPDLVLDLTTGPASVILDGQWLEYDGTDEKTGVTIRYSNKKDAKFEVTVCGTKITNEDAEKGEPITVTETVMDEGGNEPEGVITKTTVSFEYVPCDHKGQSGVKKDTKEATCTENGYTGDTYCADCDTKTASGTAIPATGHKWDAGAVTKEATETEKGIKTYTCQNGCGETKTEEIPLLEKQPDPTPKQPEPQPQGTKIEDEKGGDTFKVTSDPQASEPTVEYTAPKKGAKGTVKVPDSVTKDGVDYKVTAIADNAFKGNKKITKVTVGKNITSIGKNAFSGCTKLKTVTVGSNVTKIGDSAFKGCAAMTKVTLPAKVEKIGKNAFANCKKLKTITIKSTKLTDKNVSKGAFKGLTAKTTIKVPKSKLKAYKTLFKKKGLSKKVKVKA